MTNAIKNVLSMGSRFLGSTLLLTILLGAFATAADAQRLTYSKDQSLYPGYEGWREGPDGGYELIFGYMNQNWDQVIDAEIGPDNHFSGGTPDRGQPTHFLPRRNRFTFSVNVPASFRENDELIWTLRANGKEHRAYGTIREDLYIDNIVIMSETGALGAGSSSAQVRANIPPMIEIEGGMERNARVGQPLTLTAIVTDDGQPDMSTVRQAVAEAAISGESAASQEPEAPPTGREQLAAALRAPTGTITVSKRVKLHFTWFVYRGSDEGVAFDPPQVKSWEDTRAFANSPWAIRWDAPEIPEDGRWVSEVTFTEPGTYILRGRADDGGLYADKEITVYVAGAVS